MVCSIYRAWLGLYRGGGYTIAGCSLYEWLGLGRGIGCSFFFFFIVVVLCFRLVSYRQGLSLIGLEFKETYLDILSTQHLNGIRAFLAGKMT